METIWVTLLVCWLLVSNSKQGDPDEGLKITDLSQCKYQIEQVGCFNDVVSKRVLKEQVINSRDEKSSFYVTPSLTNNWNNFPHFLSNFVCECAKRVYEENRGQYFGIQFYAECWSGLRGQGEQDVAIDQYGEDNSNCVDSEYQTYTGDKKNCGVYCGKNSANYIYRIKKYTECPCTEYFGTVGCFHDNQTPPRPLPEYLMNERDITLPNWNGKIIDWNNWDMYMPQLVCRCAMAAKKKFFRYFGLQFYGECWAGNDTASISKHEDGKPGDCLVKLGMEPFGQNCPSLEEQRKAKGCLAQLCVGKEQTNYVYELKQGPLACASNPCPAGKKCKPNGSGKYDCV